MKVEMTKKSEDYNDGSQPKKHPYVKGGVPTDPRIMFGDPLFKSQEERNELGTGRTLPDEAPEVHGVGVKPEVEGTVTSVKRESLMSPLEKGHQGVGKNWGKSRPRASK